ncbi:MAG: hypothetical protein IT366_24500 [Candidatus Hydrogenedentes bacterium]|nr:hypothetical protein [Candidatus Hydrogenedentota bacterium]
MQCASVRQLEAPRLPRNCSGGASSRASRMTTKAQRASSGVSAMGVSKMRACFVVLLGSLFEGDSLASFAAWVKALPLSRAAWTMIRWRSAEPTCSHAFARWNPESSCWEATKKADGDGTAPDFWPVSGSMRNGIAYRRRPVAPHKRGYGHGLLLSGTLMRILGQDWPRREWVRAGGNRESGVGPREYGDIRRFPTVTPAGIRQGLSVPDGKRGLSLLAAAFLKRAPSERPQKRQGLFFEQGQIETAAANFAGWRLNPDWLELLQGLPLGWTGTAGNRESGVGFREYEDWLAGWTSLDSWGYGPGWWLGYAPGTEDLPGSIGAWERDVPRVTNCVDAMRCRLCAMAIVPIQMATAVEAMLSRRDMETA